MTLTSKEIPWRTRNMVNGLAPYFRSTPFYASCEIGLFISANFRYGCDESIAKKNYVRFPHEIKSHYVCQDSGIINFFMSRAIGLDSILVRFENYDDTGQDHLSVLVRGNSTDYLISNQFVDEVKFNEDSIETKLRFAPFHRMLSNSDVEKTSFDSVELLDLPAVVNYIRQGKHKGLEDYFYCGQMFSSQYFKNSFDQPVALYRSMKTENGRLVSQFTFEYPGLYFTHRITPDKHEFIFSGGFDNSVLINPVPAFNGKTISKNDIECTKLGISRKKRNVLHNQFAKYILASEVARNNLRKHKHIAYEGENPVRVMPLCQISKHKHFHLTQSILQHHLFEDTLQETKKQLGIDNSFDIASYILEKTDALLKQEKKKDLTIYYKKLRMKAIRKLAKEGVELPVML